MFILELLFALVVTVVATAIVGTVVYMIFGYFTYCDTVADFHGLVARIRKRSWE